MAGVAGAVVSTPSLCRCSAPQTNSMSVVSASSSSPFQHLIRLPRKCSPRLRPELSCSTSSYNGASLRYLRPGTNSRQSSLSSSSPSSFCTLSSLETSADEMEATVEPISLLLLRNFGALCTGSLVFATAGAAIAETIDLTPPPPSVEEVQTDYLLSFLFIAAFIGLAVLTVGVIYLGVTDFLENRQRTAMQKAAGEEKSEKREKGEVARIGSSKGFGVKRAEKKTEKGK